jgi:hypothetical protein
VQADEECDCGDAEACASDPCCSDHCTVADGMECSPQDKVKNPCCTDQCQFVDAAAGLSCFPGSECQDDATCDGTSSGCPDPQDKDDDSICGCQQADCAAFPDTFSRWVRGSTCRLTSVG